MAGTTALALALALASTAYAQGGPPAPDASSPGAYAGNQGLMVGVGLGIAVATCSNCDDSATALGFDFNIGGFLNPRLAIMYDVAAWIDSEDGATLTLAANTVAAQYWVAPAIWIKGGVGFSQARFSVDQASDSEFGFGLTGAAGIEVMKNGNFALDLSGRINYLDFDGAAFETLNLVVGARWK